MVQLTPEFSELLENLSRNSENCKDVVVDMRFLQFFVDDEEMYLLDKAMNVKYMFKSFEDLSDKEKTLSIRQLCKMVGVPYQFFCDNRPVVRNQIVNSWMRSSAPEEGDETLMLLKVREGGSTSVIRAILPVEYVTVPLGDLLGYLTNYPKTDALLHVDIVNGAERDAGVFHARVLFNELLEGSEYSFGVALTTSELGVSDLLVDTFLYHNETKTYLFTQYGGVPFSKVQYTKVQPSEISEMLNALPTRVQQEAPRYLESLTEGEEAFPGVERACVLLSGKKGVPKKYKRAIHLEAENAHDDMANLKDFLKHAVMVAKDYPLSDRVHVERAAGTFGGLSYAKN